MARICVVVLWATLAVGSAPIQTQPRPDPITSGFGAGAYPFGSVHPSLDKIVKPTYPESAIRAGIQGEVLLEAVVGATGVVTDVRVVKSVDAANGLDDSAVSAVRKWKFKPASIQGQKVAVVVAPRVTFFLKQPGRRDGKPFVEAGLRSPDDSLFDGVPAADTPGITVPTAVHQVPPKYTSEAMRRKIQGVIALDAIVGIDGRVLAVRVVQSLDSRYGLDQAALAAARQWRFTPARRAGVPVAVKVQIQLEFRLHQPTRQLAGDSAFLAPGVPGVPAVPG